MCDLKKSMDLVINGFGTLILGAIISAVCFITCILMPVALFIITITMLEGTEAIESIKRSFDFVVKKSGEVIVFIILVIVILIIFGVGFAFVPVVGSYTWAVASWILTVAFTVVSVHFYLSSRQSKAPSLHPSPPPPPT